MYKNLGSYELNDIQSNLKYLLRKKLFDMDKNKTNFLEKKLSLPKAIKLYLNRSNKFKEYAEYHILMLDYLLDNNLLDSFGVNKIKKRIDVVLSEILDDEFCGYPPIHVLCEFLNLFSLELLDEKYQDNFIFTTLSYLTTKDSALTNLHSEFVTASKFIDHYYDELVELEDSEWMYREIFDEGVIIKIKNFNHPLRDAMVRGFNLKSKFSLNNSSAYISDSNDLFVCILENDCDLGIEILITIITIINFGGN